MVDVNKLICQSILSYTQNRELQEVLCDVSERIECEENNFSNIVHLQPPQFMYTGSKSEGLGILANDTDIMIVFDKKLSFQENGRKCDELFIDLRTSNPGFCHIVVDNLNRDYYKIKDDEIVTLENGLTYLRRDTFVKSFTNENSLCSNFKNVTEKGPAVKIQNLDAVPSLKCTGWPEKSRQYFQRKRQGAWPTPEMLNEVYESGIHVVATPSFDTEPFTINEFRLSFSKAEKTLIRNLSTIQFATYYLMKVVKDLQELRSNKGDDYILKSYYLKTILLRKCETIRIETWNEENFLQNAKLCFEELHRSFKKGFLNHLFLDGCNLLTKLTSNQIREGAQELERIVNNWDDFIKSVFFLDEFIDELSEFTSGVMMTRGKLKRLKENSILDLKTSYRLDKLALCIEAESLSFFIFSANYYNQGATRKHNILKAIDQVIADLPTRILKNSSFVSVINQLLLRQKCEVILCMGRGRNRLQQYLQALQKIDHPICYPNSGFVDNVSSKVWISFHYYMVGNLEKTSEILETITDLDALSPTGYLSFSLTMLHQDWFKKRDIDQFFGAFLDRAFGLMKNDFFWLNVIFLAHYMRSVVVKTHSIATVEMYVNSIANVMEETACVRIGELDIKMELLMDLVTQIQMNLLFRKH